MRKLIDIVKDMQTRRVYGSLTIHFRDGRIAAVNRIESERIDIEISEERKALMKLPRLAFRPDTDR